MEHIISDESAIIPLPHPIYIQIALPRIITLMRATRNEKLMFRAKFLPTHGRKYKHNCDSTRMNTYKKKHFEHSQLTPHPILTRIRHTR